MGQRANLILKQGGQIEIRYTHHRANHLDYDLFWGPEFTLGYIRAQQDVGRDGFLDEVWAEGGAIMDLDSKSLLWFGGEDLCCDIPHRRMHCRLMSQLWPGWSIQWAEDGMADVARAIGVPVESVIAEQLEPSAARLDEYVFGPGDEKAGSCRDILSIRDHAMELHLFMIRMRPLSLLTSGSSFIKRINLAKGFDQLDREGEEFPEFGFHIDLSVKSIDWWRSSPLGPVRLAERTKGKWNGWTVRNHQDQFERHVELCEGALLLPTRSENQLVERVAEIVLRPDESRSGVDIVTEVAKLLAGKGDTVEINPHALHDAQLSLSLLKRIELFSLACERAGLSS